MLLQKDAFAWSPEAQLAFEKLKAATITTPVLSLPDLQQPLVVETYASSQGIGAVLMQNDHPLAYLSNALAKLGKENKAADALSRIHCSSLELHVVSILNSGLMSEIQQSWVSDSKLQRLIKDPVP